MIYTKYVTTNCADLYRQNHKRWNFERTIGKETLLNAPEAGPKINKTMAILIQSTSFFG